MNRERLFSRNIADFFQKFRRSRRVESDEPSRKIIQLNPVWSQIEGLRPPLTEEAKGLMRVNELVASSFIEPQMEQVLEDAQQRFMPTREQGLGFRAIFASRDGDIILPLSEGGEYEIRDMMNILEKGMEYDAEITRVSAQFSIIDQITVFDHERVFQYLTKAIRRILNLEDPALKAKIFPAILVYDLSKMERAEIGPGGYKVRFKNPDKKADALLVLYPLDIDVAK